MVMLIPSLPMAVTLENLRERIAHELKYAKRRHLPRNVINHLQDTLHEIDDALAKEASDVKADDWQTTRALCS